MQRRFQQGLKKIVLRTTTASSHPEGKKIFELLPHDKSSVQFQGLLQNPTELSELLELLLLAMRKKVKDDRGLLLQEEWYELQESGAPPSDRLEWENEGVHPQARRTPAVPLFSPGPRRSTLVGGLFASAEEYDAENDNDDDEGSSTMSSDLSYSYPDEKGACDEDRDGARGFPDQPGRLQAEGKLDKGEHQGGPKAKTRRIFQSFWCGGTGEGVDDDSDTDESVMAQLPKPDDYRLKGKSCRKRSFKKTRRSLRAPPEPGEPSSRLANGGGSPAHPSYTLPRDPRPFSTLPWS